ncbi:hypothetical protein QL285_005281 [Trifolium repens]|nr:hypothetical protein QL285_005281 [Trifolium repens]
MGKKKPCLLVRVLICFNVAADGGARRIFVNFTENMTADNHFLIPVGMLVSQEIDKDLEDIQYSGVTLFMPENVAVLQSPYTPIYKDFGPNDPDQLKLGSTQLSSQRLGDQSVQ